MRKLIKTIGFFSMIIFFLKGGEVIASDQAEYNSLLESNEVRIAPTAVIMPLQRFVLVRKDSDYCAIKFTRFWTGRTNDDLYAQYESYYQGDKSGDFSRGNVQIRKDELYYPKPTWSLFGHPVFSGGNKEIRCGPISLWWTGRGVVCFYKNPKSQGDYGIELAPTKWTVISEVNVFDLRVKWYRYDVKRKSENIPIDQLWGD